MYGFCFVFGIVHFCINSGFPAPPPRVDAPNQSEPQRKKCWSHIWFLPEPRTAFKMLFKIPSFPFRRNLRSKLQYRVRVLLLLLPLNDDESVVWTQPPAYTTTRTGMPVYRRNKQTHSVDPMFGPHLARFRSTHGATQCSGQSTMDRCALATRRYTASSRGMESVGVYTVCTVVCLC